MKATRLITETVFLPAVPVNCAELPVLVPLALKLPVLVPLALGVSGLVVARVQLAQVILVVLAKWTTRDRFPKKAPRPDSVDAKSSL